MSAVWRIELLGGLRVSSEGRAVTHFRTRKTAELLAYLAYHLPRSYPRDLLVELLWPECQVDAGRHSLNVALSSLRQQLQGEAGAEGGGPLHTDRFTVGLAPQQVTTDVAEFEGALRAAEKAASAAEKVEALTTAVELYRGGLLPGYYEDWICSEQQRLDELYFQSLKRLILLLEATGEYDTALQHGLRAVRQDPLREEAHREVIRLYAVSGRAAAARKQYSELERVLREELDTRPTPETLELVRQIDALAETATRRRARVATPPPQAPPPAVEAALPVETDTLEPVGGAVPLGSRFYIEREADPQFHAAVARKDMIVLVKGARQVGKTSLLARGLHQARQAGWRVVLTHFQMFNESHLSSADAFLTALAASIAEQLDLDVMPQETWDPWRGPNPNFRRYLRREVLANLDRPLVWGLDEVDRLFEAPFSSEVFGLFRSWHDERALDPGGAWSGLSMVMAYSTEAHLFIKNVHQSPFNVGTRLTLDDFTQTQVADLNARYGGPLRDERELSRFFGLLNGHPFLVRQGLHALKGHGVTLAALEERAGEEDWIFGPHLRRIASLLNREPELRAEALGLLDGRPLANPESLYRLRSAGIVGTGQSGQARLRCALYERCLRWYLG